MNEILRQRWHSSTDLFANALHSQLMQSQDATDDVESALCGATAIPKVSNKWLEKVASLYDEPHRAYHNISHIEDVLSSLDVLMVNESPQKPMDMAMLTLAAFFHDVIYNPKSSRNEKDSANLFLDFVSELLEKIANSEERAITSTDVNSTILSKKSKMIRQIEECIIATATHISSAKQARLSNNTLIAAFLDADMSILGKDSETYDQYAKCIRKEYKFIPKEFYCEKRAEILESFLPVDNVDEAESATSNENYDVSTTSESPGAGGGEKRHKFIYATEKGRELWEDRARMNLKQEIDLLRRGTIPGEEK